MGRRSSVHKHFVRGKTLRGLERFEVEKSRFWNSRLLISKVFPIFFLQDCRAISGCYWINISKKMNMYKWRKSWKIPKNWHFCRKRTLILQYLSFPNTLNIPFSIRYKRSWRLILEKSFKKNKNTETKIEAKNRIKSTPFQTLANRYWSLYGDRQNVIGRAK